MLKKALLAIGLAMTAAVAASAATFVAQLQLHIDQDDSTAALVENDNSTGHNVYAESRVKSGSCEGDLVTTGAAFTDGSILAPQETGFVAESPCAGMIFKDNSDTYIRFTFSNIEAARIVPGSTSVDGGTQFYGRRNGYLLLQNRISGTNGGIIADDGGNFYIGSKTNSPFHLMANFSAEVTVYPGGGAEIWPGNCPASPQHGGMLLCVNSSGQLLAIGKNGTSTTIAQP